VERPLEREATGERSVVAAAAVADEDADEEKGWKAKDESPAWSLASNRLGPSAGQWLRKTNALILGLGWLSRVGLTREEEERATT
jgi:hypothetical protein